MLLIPEIQINFDELYEALVKSYKDPLTSCLNARAWAEQRLNPTDHRWAFYLDLDNLKRINDTQGHEAGDRYIERSAQAIRSVFKRSTDSIFRVGGDEFVVLSSYRPEDLSVLSMFSIGVSEIVGELDEAIFAADKAMYENKRARKTNAKQPTTKPKVTL